MSTVKSWKCSRCSWVITQWWSKHIDTLVIFYSAIADCYHHWYKSSESCLMKAHPEHSSRSVYNFLPELKRIIVHRTRRLELENTCFDCCGIIAIKSIARILNSIDCGHCHLKPELYYYSISHIEGNRSVFGCLIAKNFAISLGASAIHVSW